MADSIYSNIAKTILAALHVEERQDYIDGIITLLETQREITNNEWEAFIELSTNDILAMDNICCVHCQAPIQITRTRNTVYVGEDYDEEQ